ncbi:hypothetical protein FQB35_13820 [Crassaminicella thermophila]|uniref:Copper amine oxidase-like N-terminal domain-containing protein n=1 Tax=Crassaminicella thermophila TaxID=2599308 RepID=A0A5C0SH05_CRATE|nr:stalk domain-containing protein [Crassaminicella thermophila]QEK13262.1 hypothetical protein FQB35_13820 [Crassaminicella thermophila]
MKKRFILALVLTFIFGTITGTSTGYSEKILAWFYDIKINLDGKPLGFYRQPFIYNGQVYVSLNDIANNMGLGIQWDDENKIMNLSSNGNNLFTINMLQQSLDQKNLEIANLKFQLSQKELELGILRDNKNSSNKSDNKKLNDLEDLLEDDYDTHRNNHRTLGFDNYKLTKYSDEIDVKMYGDFDRTSSYWRYRDESDFEDFIEDICKEIDKEFNKDIEITIYDKDKDKVARYAYDESKDRLTEEYIYGSSNNDLDYLEKKLEDDYDTHRNNHRTLGFNDYKLTKYSNEIDVKMYGDFDRTSSYWKDRDKSDFRDFIEDICKKVHNTFDDKDVKVYVYDKDDSQIARYTYDEDDQDLNTNYEYEN